MNKKILNFVTYINSNAHICGSKELFFQKFRSFILGYRYNRFISVIVKNVYMLKMYLNMNIYALYKYGVFCFICINKALSFYTKVLALKVKETYMCGWWINGFLTNYKYVVTSKLLKIKKNFNTPRLPSVVFFDSLKFARVAFVLDECQKLTIPSLSILESDLEEFKSSYFTVSNSQSMATYLLYIYTLGANILKIKNKKIFGLFTECLSVDYLYSSKSVFRLNNLKLSIQFYMQFASNKKLFIFKIGKSSLLDCFRKLLHFKFSKKIFAYLRRYNYSSYGLPYKKKGCAILWRHYKVQRLKRRRKRWWKNIRRERKLKKMAELELKKKIRNYMWSRFKIKWK